MTVSCAQLWQLEEIGGEEKEKKEKFKDPRCLLLTQEEVGVEETKLAEKAELVSFFFFRSGTKALWIHRPCSKEGRRGE